MTSFAPPKCRHCQQEVVLAISGKTGRRIRLNSAPGPDGTFSVAVEHQGLVARFMPKDHRSGDALWVAHAATCAAMQRPPRRVTPRTLTLGFASDHGTASEVALARTDAHSAELALERLADELLAEWREKCRREGWMTVWRLVPTFIAQHAELSRPLRDKFSTVLGRKVHPAAAASFDKAHPQKTAQ